MSLGRFQNRNLPGMNNFRKHGVEDEPEVSGTQIPRRGSLYAMLGDIRYITLFRSTRYLDSFLVSLV